ncbi:MAG TPA: nicotinate-nucleotide adenylyltransferase [Rhodanobacteraceae bacterium]|jgi:nicotinate-nucleotide adenylyltransferase|nr:nicotinate-nucleotide adenylyltransferase [Rhodanobacteraceae bacterium]
MTRPLAILGGTFDPVHNAHLRVAWEAAELLDAEVRLIPANVPPHRDQPIASARERAEILRAALGGQDRLVLDERELGREGPSWTIDTLIDLRAEIGDELPLVLLIGADAFLGLSSWHRWGELFDYAHIGVLTRPGHEIGSLPTELRIKVASRRCVDALALMQTPAGRVLQMPVTPLEISATHVRELLAAGAEPRYLMPDAVIENPTLLAPYRR